MNADRDTTIRARHAGGVPVGELAAQFNLSRQRVSAIVHRVKPLLSPAETLRREQAHAKRSALEEAMALQLRAAGIHYVREYRFHETRRFRFDFSFPPHLIALEVEGGTHTGGRHTNGTGFELDCAKYNEALIAGWRVLRVTGTQVRDGRALGYVERALAA